MTAQAVPRWLRGPAKIVLGLLNGITWVLARVFSRRGLRLCFLALAAWLALRGWLQPPLSDNIGAFQIPLMESNSSAHGPVAQLYGPRTLVLLSPGTLLLVVLVIGAAVAIRRPNRFSVAAGLLVCVVLGCLATVLLNHPELMSLLDDQLDQRKQIVAALAGTADPPLRITDVPRVEASPDPDYEPGTLLSGVAYLHTHRFLLLMLAAMGCLLTTRGTLGRRVGHLALWTVAGLVLAVGLTRSRLSAEWQWSRATTADWRGEWDAAERHVDAAIARFPGLARIERTWVLLGKLDYRRGRKSPRAAYFHAYQRLQSNDFRPAIEELTDLVRVGEPTPVASRWLASWEGRFALSEFHSGRNQVAEDEWRRAIAADATPSFRPLLVATLRARASRSDPGVVAELVDPLLGSLKSDRTMRAALLAMLGDAYFEAGRFIEARARYEQSTDIYNLPKHVNFRAQRGLLGM